MAKKMSRWEQLADAGTGHLITAMPFKRLWVIDYVTIESNALCFWYMSDLKLVRVPVNLLERFLLANTDERLLRFAQRYGPLRDEKPNRPELDRYDEPLSRWRELQWELSYLLGLTALLRDDSDIEADPWLEFARHGIRVEPAGPWQPSRAWNEKSKQNRRELSAALRRHRVEALVSATELRPDIHDTDGGRKVDIVFHDGRRGRTSLGGALVGQFLAAVAGTGYASCSACGNIFVPKRRQPAFGKRRYCPRCGRRAALRDAKADFRRRERAKRMRA